MPKRLLLVCLMLCACETPYQPRGFAGGYTDWSQERGVYHIEVNGNGFTGATLLRQYFNRRALELCRREGFSGYQTLTQGLEVSSTPTGTSYHSSTHYNSFTNSYETTGHVSGGGSISKGNVVGDIACTSTTP